MSYLFSQRIVRENEAKKNTIDDECSEADAKDGQAQGAASRGLLVQVLLPG